MAYTQISSNKITFYTKSTLHKLLCKLKDWLAAEDKINMAYETDCGKCKAVYFNESKWSLNLHSDEQKRSVRNFKTLFTTDHNFVWDQKKVVVQKSRLISSQIKEAIHYLKNHNHINKILCMLPEILLPNLW